MRTAVRILSCLVFLSIIIRSQSTIIHCGVLIDGSADRVSNKVSVIIQNGKISEVSRGYKNPGTDDSVIDLSKYTVLPGLMDMHTHLSGQSNPKRYMERFTMDLDDYAFRAVPYAERTLMAGFTTVRELGGPVSTSLRDAIQQGHVVGPRIFSAGKSLATTGGHADPTNGMRFELMGDPGPAEGVVNGIADARKAVRQRYKNGADLVKITATGGVLSVAKSGENPQFKEEEIRAIVETAADYDMHVAAHAHGAEGMKRAVRAGVRSIEHGTLMDEETMILMKKHGTFYVPTISAGEFVAEKAKVDGYYPEIVRPKAAKIGPQIQNTFSKAYKAGVKIAFGTDSGVSYHGDNAREFEFMVKGGMSPMEAIQSATKTAAELLGVEGELGTIETGKIADIIAVKGNPLEDITVLQEVSFVMKNGQVYKDKTAK
ncbi:MAG: amidohydrolase family protein [Candidatus Marinimicrobia bacterium]|nr:amidohydrolase family protein [Candidatus Neomarinimicrobiota bacterium]